MNKKIFSTKFTSSGRDTACSRENAKQATYCTADLEHQTNDFATESWVLLDSESGADTTGSLLFFIANS